jgi:hypothetical protein
MVDDDNIEIEFSTKEILRLLDSENLMFWWISVFTVILSVIAYRVLSISPLKELIVLAAFIFFIIMTWIKFWR